MERFKNVGWALQFAKVKNEADKIEMYVKKKIHYNHIRNKTNNQSNAEFIFSYYQKYRIQISFSAKSVII